MKIAFISDTHNVPAERGIKLDIPTDIDLLIHSGDHTFDGTPPEWDVAMAWLATLPGKRKVTIPGNHDFHAQRNPKGARSVATQYGIDLLIDEEVTIEGFTIWGSPWQPWFHDWAFNFPRNDRLVPQGHYAKIPALVDILVTHGPPHGILDTVLKKNKTWDSRAGDPDLLNAIFRIRPLIHAFGHIHESYGTLNTEIIADENQGGCSPIKFINAATCNRDYEPVNKPIVVKV